MSKLLSVEDPEYKALQDSIEQHAVLESHLAEIKRVQKSYKQAICLIGIGDMAYFLMCVKGKFVVAGIKDGFIAKLVTAESVAEKVKDHDFPKLAVLALQRIAAGAGDALTSARSMEDFIEECAKTL